MKGDEQTMKTIMTEEAGTSDNKLLGTTPSEDENQLVLMKPIVKARKKVPKMMNRSIERIIIANKDTNNIAKESASLLNMLFPPAPQKKKPARRMPPAPTILQQENMNRYEGEIQNYLQELHAEIIPLLHAIVQFLNEIEEEDDEDIEQGHSKNPQERLLSKNPQLIENIEKDLLNRYFLRFQEEIPQKYLLDVNTLQNPESLYNAYYERYRTILVAYQGMLMKEVTHFLNYYQQEMKMIQFLYFQFQQLLKLPMNKKDLRKQFQFFQQQLSSFLENRSFQLSITMTSSGMPILSSSSSSSASSSSLWSSSSSTSSQSFPSISFRILTEKELKEWNLSASSNSFPILENFDILVNAQLSSFLNHSYQEILQQNEQMTLTICGKYLTFFKIFRDKIFSSLPMKDNQLEEFVQQFYRKLQQLIIEDRMIGIEGLKDFDFLTDHQFLLQINQSIELLRRQNLEIGKDRSLKRDGPLSSPFKGTDDPLRVDQLGYSSSSLQNSSNKAESPPQSSSSSLSQPTPVPGPPGTQSPEQGTIRKEQDALTKTRQAEKEEEEMFSRFPSSSPCYSLYLQHLHRFYDQTLSTLPISFDQLEKEFRLFLQSWDAAIASTLSSPYPGGYRALDKTILEEKEKLSFLAVNYFFKQLREKNEELSLQLEEVEADR